MHIHFILHAYMWNNCHMFGSTFSQRSAVMQRSVTVCLQLLTGNLLVLSTFQLCQSSTVNHLLLMTATTFSTLLYNVLLLITLPNYYRCCYYCYCWQYLVSGRLDVRSNAFNDRMQTAQAWLLQFTLYHSTQWQHCAISICPSVSTSLSSHYVGQQCVI